MSVPDISDFGNDNLAGNKGRMCLGDLVEDSRVILGAGILPVGQAPSETMAKMGAVESQESRKRCGG